MKRLLLLFVTTVLALGVLAACGQGGQSGQDGTEGTSEDTTQNEENMQEGSDSEGNTSDQEETENSGDQNDNQSQNEEDTGSNTDVEQEDSVNAGESGETVTETVTLYFSDNQLLEKYTEEQEVEASSEEALPAAALQAWIDGPDSEQLTSHFPEDSSVEVQSVEGVDGTAEVSFNSAFLDVNAGSSAEQAMTEQIALIMQQFGYDQAKILVDGEEQSSLFGHMDATQAFSAENGDEYSPVE
ncbi:GerMN domain-containing protein [Salibacterium halotolerans]|uniref:Sporulation and spore germination n=1 Tax=Salibacterium halotolerans TaxID=1884432 RepID=A0A1I5XF41_9BACI|nr:GerMN domain-containing protein [Salibacterium halotolerans]SFQ30436.1 Sporulation and spore germination [Salibacterium halotolerans]